MITLRKILVTGVCLFGISNQVSAIPIGQSAFSGSENLIDFNGLTSGTSITNQYAGLGVTFSGSPFQADPFPATTINGTMSAANHQPINNPITATFDTTQNRIGMMFGTPIGFVSTVGIEAFLGATLVDSATFVAAGLQPGGNVPTVFGGLEVSGGFDRIEFRSFSGNLSFQIDDFRFESTQVPEPATLTLMCLGLAGIGFARKKTQ